MTKQPTKPSSPSAPASPETDLSHEDSKLARSLARKFSKRYGHDPAEVYQDAALLVARFIGPDAGQRPPAVELRQWLYMKVWGALECRYARGVEWAALVRAAAIGKGRLNLDEPDHTETVAAVNDVRAAVAKLPEDIRRAVELVMLGGMTQVEASVELSVSQAQVCKWLQRGEKLLQQLLAAYKD